MKNLEQNRIEVINNYFAKIDNRAFDENYYNLVTEDVQLYFPKFGFKRGKAGLSQLGERFGRFIKKLRHDFECFNYISQGDQIVVEGIVEGETVDGIKWPDNEFAHGRFCNVFEFEGLLIKRVHIYEDPDFTSQDLKRIEIFGLE